MQNNQTSFNTESDNGLDTYTMWAGSLRPLTQTPFSHFSFFLLSNLVLMCLKPACVGRISHHGASKYRWRKEFQYFRALESSRRQTRILPLGSKALPPDLTSSMGQSFLWWFPQRKESSQISFIGYVSGKIRKNPNASRMSRRCELPKYEFGLRQR